MGRAMMIPGFVGNNIEGVVGDGGRQGLWNELPSAGQAVRADSGGDLRHLLHAQRPLRRRGWTRSRSGAVAMYTFVDKLRTGLTQFMAGARSFRLDTLEPGRRDRPHRGGGEGLRHPLRHGRLQGRSGADPRQLSLRGESRVGDRAPARGAARRWRPPARPGYSIPSRRASSGSCALSSSKNAYWVSVLKVESSTANSWEVWSLGCRVLVVQAHVALEPVAVGGAVQYVGGVIVGRLPLPVSSSVSICSPEGDHLLDVLLLELSHESLKRGDRRRPLEQGDQLLDGLRPGGGDLIPEWAPCGTRRGRRRARAGSMVVDSPGTGSSPAHAERAAPLRTMIARRATVATQDASLRPKRPASSGAGEAGRSGLEGPVSRFPAHGAPSARVSGSRLRSGGRAAGVRS